MKTEELLSDIYSVVEEESDTHVAVQRIRELLAAWKAEQEDPFAGADTLNEGATEDLGPDRLDFARRQTG